jgi:hypothetical protein
MKTFGCMMVDCCPQVLEIAPWAAVRTPMLHIVAAICAGDLREPLAASVFIETLKPFIELGLVSLPVTRVVVIDREDISDID